MKLFYSLASVFVTRSVSEEYSPTRTSDNGFRICMQRSLSGRTQALQSSFTVAPPEGLHQMPSILERSERDLLAEGREPSGNLQRRSRFNRTACAVPLRKETALLSGKVGVWDPKRDCSTKSSRVRDHRPHAFTLIETVIAMTLLTLLMVIVWTMFDVYTKLEIKGVAAAEESGLVRAVDRQLRKDLLHIVAIDQYRETSISHQTDRSASQFASNGYLVGSSTDLHFVVSGEPPTPAAADLIRVISYEPRLMVEDESTETDPTIDSSPELEDSFVGELDTPLGIDRRDRSWRTYQENRTSNESLEQILSTNRPISLDADDIIQVGKTFDDDQSEDRRLVAEETIDEIPEIQRLSFRYFDGSSWTSQWDSTVAGRLPLAIEIGFSVEAVRTDQANSTEYRFTVLIPAATLSDIREETGNDENQNAGLSDSLLEPL